MITISTEHFIWNILAPGENYSISGFPGAKIISLSLRKIFLGIKDFPQYGHIEESEGHYYLWRKIEWQSEWKAHQEQKEKDASWRAKLFAKEQRIHDCVEAMVKGLGGQLSKKLAAEIVAMYLKDEVSFKKHLTKLGYYKP